MLFKLGFVQGGSEAVTDGRHFNGACQSIKAIRLLRQLRLLSLQRADLP